MVKISVRRPKDPDTTELDISPANFDEAVEAVKKALSIDSGAVALFAENGVDITSLDDLTDGDTFTVCVDGEPFRIAGTRGMAQRSPVPIVVWLTFPIPLFRVPLPRPPPLRCRDVEVSTSTPSSLVDENERPTSATIIRRGGP